MRYKISIREAVKISIREAVKTGDLYFPAAIPS